MCVGKASALLTQSRGKGKKSDCKKEEIFKKKHYKPELYLITKGQYPNLFNLLSQKATKNNSNLGQKNRRIQIQGKDNQDEKDVPLLVLNQIAWCGLVAHCGVVTDPSLLFKKKIQHLEVLMWNKGRQNDTERKRNQVCKKHLTVQKNTFTYLHICMPFYICFEYINNTILQKLHNEYNT